MTYGLLDAGRHCSGRRRGRTAGRVRTDKREWPDESKALKAGTRVRTGWVELGCEETGRVGWRKGERWSEIRSGRRTGGARRGKEAPTVGSRALLLCCDRRAFARGAASERRGRQAPCSALLQQREASGGEGGRERRGKEGKEGGLMTRAELEGRRRRATAPRARLQEHREHGRRQEGEAMNGQTEGRWTYVGGSGRGGVGGGGWQAAATGDGGEGRTARQAPTDRPLWEFSRRFGAAADALARSQPHARPEVPTLVWLGRLRPDERSQMAQAHRVAHPRRREKEGGARRTWDRTHTGPHATTSSSISSSSSSSSYDAASYSSLLSYPSSSSSSSAPSSPWPAQTRSTRLPA